MFATTQGFANHFTFTEFDCKAEFHFTINICPSAHLGSRARIGSCAIIALSDNCAVQSVRVCMYACMYVYPSYFN